MKLSGAERAKYQMAVRNRESYVGTLSA